MKSSREPSSKVPILDINATVESATIVRFNARQDRRECDQEVRPGFRTVIVEDASRSARDLLARSLVCSC